MKTVLFLVQNHLSSCTILAAELKESAQKDMNLLVRGTFTWQSGEMSENFYEGIKGAGSEKELKTEQLQRKDLEQADTIVVISQAAEESLKHLLKASDKDHEIIRIEKFNGRSMEDLEHMLQGDQEDEAIKDLKQKSVELAAKL
ncbi:hypothetical protein [Jeotgalibacillus malaysiensis]|uniref:hypothetical protein n=1 Tax=Jeotgalibacillus malaysiensis TaxID=1508404 RepID=UPI00384FCC9B